MVSGGWKLTPLAGALATAAASEATHKRNLLQIMRDRNAWQSHCVRRPASLFGRCPSAQIDTSIEFAERFILYKIIWPNQKFCWLISNILTASTPFFSMASRLAFMATSCDFCDNCKRRLLAAEFDHWPILYLEIIRRYYEVTHFLTHKVCHKLKL